MLVMSLSRSSELSTKSAAEYLGVTPGTMRLWRNKGIGPRYRKISERIYKYLVGDLEQYLAAQK